MGLKVIGSGFGRTGTKSVKDALEKLGFGPCHHMYEVVAEPGRVTPWTEYAAGRPVDWGAVFDGFSSQVDWPGAHIWHELSELYPEAKVVHTRRPEESWARSFSKTIGTLMNEFEQMPLPPHIRDMMTMARDKIIGETFDGDHMDHDVQIAAYRKRTDDVVAAIPPERLLIFDVAEGWAPLCAFLEVDVPDIPFPHENLEADFWEKLKPPA